MDSPRQCVPVWRPVRYINILIFRTVHSAGVHSERRQRRNCRRWLGRVWLSRSGKTTSGHHLVSSRLSAHRLIFFSKNYRMINVVQTSCTTEIEPAIASSQVHSLSHSGTCIPRPTRSSLNVKQPSARAYYDSCCNDLLFFWSPGTSMERKSSLAGSCVCRLPVLMIFWCLHHSVSSPHH